MDGESRARVQLLVAYVAFKVFRLLVLHQDLVVVEFTVAVPAPALLLRRLLFLATHGTGTRLAGNTG